MNDKVNILAHLPRFNNNIWQTVWIRIFSLTAWIKLIFGVCHYLSDKSFLTVTEYGIKHLIILFKDRIKHLPLQSWLELNEHLGFFDDGIIILELLVEEHPCHVTCVGIKMNVFTNFAH